MNQRIAIACACGVVVASACGGSGGSNYSGLVDVKVFPVKGATLSSAAEDPFDPARARLLRTSVSGPYISTPVESVTDFASHQGSIEQIPFGYSRQVTVEVCAANCDPKVAGDILARGRSVPFDVLDERSKQSVSVFVAPRNAFTTPATAAIPPQPSRPSSSNLIGATATQLVDGRILLLGGARVKSGAASWYRAADLETVLNQAEVYDPQTGQFSAVGPMTRARAFHQAVVIPDGRVVILGGYTQEAQGPVKLDATVEVFDPKTGTFALSANQDGSPIFIPPQPDAAHGVEGGRALFQAALLAPNSPLIVLTGGVANPSVAGAYVDVYLLDVGTVCHVGLKAARYNHAMVYVPNWHPTQTNSAGSPAFVLFGGENDTGTLDLVEAFTVNPTGSCVPGAGAPMIVVDSSDVRLPGGGRTLLAAAYVPKQQIVYVIGGFNDAAHQNPSGLVNPYRTTIGNFLLDQQGNPIEGFTLDQPRGAMTATLMEHDTVLIAGGIGANGAVLSTMELIVEDFVCDPDGQNCRINILRVVGATPPMPQPRAGHLALFDATSRVLFAGGFSSPYTPVQDIVFYNPD